MLGFLRTKIDKTKNEKMIEYRKYLYFQINVIIDKQLLRMQIYINLIVEAR